MCHSNQFVTMPTMELTLRFISLCTERALTKDQHKSAEMLEVLNSMDAELTRREEGALKHVAGSH